MPAAASADSRLARAQARRLRQSRQRPSALLLFFKRPPLRKLLNIMIAIHIITTTTTTITIIIATITITVIILGSAPRPHAPHRGGPGRMVPCLLV